MKKFKLQTGHVVTVDDCDAYLFRSYVWRGSETREGYVEVMKGAGKTERLSHFLVGPAEVVHFRNGNSLDCRRENLQPMTKREFYETVISNETSKGLHRYWAKKATSAA